MSWNKSMVVHQSLSWRGTKSIRHTRWPAASARWTYGNSQRFTPPLHHPTLCHMSLTSRTFWPMASERVTGRQRPELGTWGCSPDSRACPSSIATVATPPPCALRSMSCEVSDNYPGEWIHIVTLTCPVKVCPRRSLSDTLPVAEVNQSVVYPRPAVFDKRSTAMHASLIRVPEPSTPQEPRRPGVSSAS